MTPAHILGCRLLRALGCHGPLLYTLVAEIRYWRPIVWGALDEDDLWALAAMTVWQLASGPHAHGYVRQRVHRVIQNALRTERRVHGWTKSAYGPWRRPRRPLRPPEWDWGRPFRLVAA